MDQSRTRRRTRTICLRLRRAALYRGFVIRSALDRPRFCRLQVADAADCPSPLRFDATAPKPEAKAGKSALQRGLASKHIWRLLGGFSSPPARKTDETPVLRYRPATRRLLGRRRLTA